MYFSDYCRWCEATLQIKSKTKSQWSVAKNISVEEQVSVPKNISFDGQLPQVHNSSLVVKKKQQLSFNSDTVNSDRYNNKNISSSTQWLVPKNISLEGQLPKVYNTSLVIKKKVVNSNRVNSDRYNSDNNSDSNKYTRDLSTPSFSNNTVNNLLIKKKSPVSKKWDDHIRKVNVTSQVKSNVTLDVHVNGTVNVTSKKNQTKTGVMFFGLFFIFGKLLHQLITIYINL